MSILLNIGIKPNRLGDGKVIYEIPITYWKLMTYISIKIFFLTL